MATSTTNYDLEKPADNESADITVINSNMDIIDTALKELFTSANDKTVIKTAIIGKKGTVLDANGDGIYTNQEMADGVNTIKLGQGVAIENQVENGVTFSNSDGAIRTGTKPKKSGIIYTPTTSDQTISIGFEDGTCIVKGDSNHISANIKAGITDFGVVGKASVVDTSDATAVASTIVSGSTGYVNGAKVDGTATIETLGGIRKAFGSTTSTVISGNEAYSLITVNGLTFTPSILLLHRNGYAESQDVTVIVKANAEGSNISLIGAVTDANGTSVIGSTGGYSMNSTGFTAWVRTPSVSYNWIAIE